MTFPESDFGDPHILTIGIYPTCIVVLCTSSKTDTYMYVCMHVICIYTIYLVTSIKMK